MTNPTSRMLTLLSHLENRVSWSGPELAEQLGVSVRTLRRDIDRLRSLGYVVEADAGPGGGYVLGRGQVLPPLLLDDEQALAVALALLRFATNVDGDMSQTALGALSRIETFMPSKVRERLTALQPTTSFLAGEASEIQTLLTCADAIRRKLRVEFSYTDRHGECTARRVEPHRLVVRSRSWLLLAYDLMRDGWRSFRVDRIESLVMGTWHFDEREGVEEALAMLEQPVPSSAWKHQVEVEIYAPRAKVQQELPKLANYLTEVDEVTTLFSSGAAHPEEAAWWLSGIPFEFRVLGDAAVIEAVGRLGERLRSAVVDLEN